MEGTFNCQVHHASIKLRKPGIAAGYSIITTAQSILLVLTNNLSLLIVLFPLGKIAIIL